MNCLEDCRAACCHDVVFSFDGITDLQIKQFQDAGAYLTSHTYGIYTRLNGACPYLTSNKTCGVYHDSVRRPKDCSRMMPGDSNCLKARQRDGIILLSTINKHQV